METEQHDSIGVVLAQDANGKFKAMRVFLQGNTVIKEEVLTNGRALTWALKAALESLERLPRDWGRKEIEFAQPESRQLKLFEHTKK